MLNLPYLFTGTQENLRSSEKIWEKMEGIPLGYREIAVIDLAQGITDCVGWFLFFFGIVTGLYCLIFFVKRVLLQDGQIGYKWL